MEKIKIHEARFISRNEDRLGKRVKRWEMPLDLRDLNKENEYRTLVGIGKWNNKRGGIYVCLSQGKQLLYIEKKVWLEITKSV